MVLSKYYKALALSLKGSGPYICIHTAEHHLSHFEISNRDIFAGMLETLQKGLLLYDTQLLRRRKVQNGSSVKL